MNELPSPWAVAQLSDCVFFQEGPGLRKWQFGDEGIPFLNIRTFQNGSIDRSKCQFVKYEEFNGKYEHFLLDEGDIVVSSSGTLGKIALISEGDLPLMLNTSTIRFRSLSEEVLLQSYLKFYLQSHHVFQQIESSKTGSAILNYGPSHLKEMEIIVPPLNEQRRIVAKLDEVLGRVAACRGHLDRVPKIHRRFRQSVLSAACSGRLTADWREANSTEEWREATLTDVIQGKPKNGYSAKPVKYETAQKVLTLTATTSGVFDGKHYKYFDENIPINSPFWLQPNDILVQRGNTIDYVGVPAVYGGAPSAFIYPDLMMKFRANEEMETQFLYFLLSWEKSRAHLRERATGTAGNMPKINQSTLCSLPVVIPPIEEQREIVRRTNELLQYADGIEARYQAARKHFDRLSQSVLAQAFRGELVEQNPNDEPAGVLLERIREAREQTPSTPAASKRSIPASRGRRASQPRSKVKTNVKAARLPGLE